MTARQRSWAAAISLNAMPIPAASEPGPLVTLSSPVAKPGRRGELTALIFGKPGPESMPTHLSELLDNPYLDHEWNDDQAIHQRAQNTFRRQKRNTRATCSGPGRYRNQR